MKILYINADTGIPVLGRKGAAVHVRAMVSAFTEIGHRVVLVTPSLNKSPWETPAKLCGDVCLIPPSDEVKAAALSIREFSESLGGIASALPGEIRRILYNEQLQRRLIRKFDSDPPDFIYERVSLYATAGAHLAKAINRPLILELNAPLSTEQATYRGTGLGQLAEEAERWVLNQADAVLVVSQQLAAYVEANGVMRDRIHVVPNGVDPICFSPNRNTEHSNQWNPNGGPVLGFVGGLRPWHGVDVLPELLARLVPDYPNMKLLIAGDGPQRAELESEFERRNVESNVTMTGLIAHADIPSVINVMDVALAPYPKLDHSFYFSPLKVFEYMACGIPVVASALGQLTELIENNRTGLTYPAGDIDALEVACRKLLSNESLRKQLGAAAAAVIRHEYTWRTNAERITDLAVQLGHNSRELVTC